MIHLIYLDFSYSFINFKFYMFNLCLSDYLNSIILCSIVKVFVSNFILDQAPK